MSLPVSLTTDCGGLLNRRGPGRKCCCHTGLFTRDIRFTLHTDCSCPELSNCFIFTRRITESHGFIVPNYRIGLFSHGMSRMVTAFLSRDLSFGSTDQREVICELSNFSSHGESRRVTGFCHELSNCRISFHTESHGESRDLCHELSNCRISFHTESHGGFLCHETCSWSRIYELSNFFLHAECHGWLWRL